MAHSVTVDEPENQDSNEEIKEGKCQSVVKIGRGMRQEPELLC
jgi:hypothetical protein